jgi:ketosteroid isomerase-like protein
MTHPNAALIERFYASFARKDAEGMAACYHQDIIFRDPVFGELRGDRARDMWRMLAARAKNLTIETSGIEADERAGKARWIATYTFGKTGRRVRNVIDARFEFSDGKIARHEDTFPLWAWSRMALGPVGTLLGWTPMVQAKIRKDALKGLDAYQTP